VVVATSSSPCAIGAAWLAERRRVVAASLVERIGSAPLDPTSGPIHAATDAAEAIDTEEGS
jgi:hypothetical protein